MNEVYELQNYLRVLSTQDPTIPLLNPDGIFGAETTDAVRAYQRAVNLSPTGFVDWETWSHLYEDYDRLLDRETSPFPFVLPLELFGGEASIPALCLVQVLLSLLGKRYENLPPVAITGKNDAATIAAIKAFQAKCGLEESGVFDKGVWKMFVILFELAQ